MNFWVAGWKWGQIVSEFGKVMYTLLYLTWKTNQDLLEFCSVLCVSLDERGLWGRMDTCTYTWLNPFTVHLKLLQHCFV